MNKQGIPPDVIQFISSYIRSIEELEILVLVAEQPSRNWTVEEVDQIIRSTPKSVQSRLESLKSSGLVRRAENGSEVHYTYAPESEEKGGLAVNALEAYRSYRLEVIELIYSSHTRTMVSFSDAFKIRSKKDDS